MKSKLLSDRLKFWRVERPDEWIMSEFIREAEELEKQVNKIAEVNEFCQKRGIGKIGDSAVSALMRRHDELEAEVERLSKEVSEKINVINTDMLSSKISI